MKKNTWWIILLIFLGFLCLCCCVAAVIFGAVTFGLDSLMQNGLPLSMDTVPFPQESFFPPSDAAFDMLALLDETIVPENDPEELARRLKGIDSIPELIPARSYELGEAESFWVSNMDSDENFQVTATLEAITDHAYFWVEEGVEFEPDDLDALAATFEEQIYPVNREFFGSEWTPGIDGDEHIYLLYAGNLGANIAGYFSSVDSLPPIVHMYSNAHETFVFNADVLNLGDAYTYSTLAHEFQHMIHWYQDRNESTWVNEGFAELATVLNGYSPGGFDLLYLMNPDVQLNTWPVNPTEQSVHYGSSFLFMQYFLSRFGETATQALVSNPLDGMESIDAVLEQLDLRDPLEDDVLQAEDVFVDWTITNAINDERIDAGQYAYQNYEPVRLDIPLIAQRINDCTGENWLETDVRQFGVDVMHLRCAGDYTLVFEGIGEVGLLPVDAHSGEYAYWSNKGSESDMLLSKQFDLSSVQDSAELSYHVWFDLEEDYDYVYVLASEDGQNWEFLETKQGTGLNPVGNSFGWGYTGSSDGWVEDRVDLSAYVGKKVWVRFEYITDAALNGEGLLLDDFELQAIGYEDDIEAGTDDWQSEGFVRVQNRLAQSYAVSVIYLNEENTVIEKHQFFGGNTENIDLRLDEDWQDVLLLVSGTTRYTEQPAPYRVILSPVE